MILAERNQNDPMSADARAFTAVDWQPSGSPYHLNFPWCDLGSIGGSRARLDLNMVSGNVRLFKIENRSMNDFVNVKVELIEGQSTTAIEGGTFTIEPNSFKVFNLHAPVVVSQKVHHHRIKVKTRGEASREIYLLLTVFAEADKENA